MIFATMFRSRPLALLATATVLVGLVTQARETVTAGQKTPVREGLYAGAQLIGAVELLDGCRPPTIASRQSRDVLDHGSCRFKIDLAPETGMGDWIQSFWEGDPTARTLTYVSFVRSKATLGLTLRNAFISSVELPALGSGNRGYLILELVPQQVSEAADLTAFARPSAIVSQLSGEMTAAIRKIDERFSATSGGFRFVQAYEEEVGLLGEIFRRPVGSVQLQAGSAVSLSSSDAETIRALERWYESNVAHARANEPLEKRRLGATFLSPTGVTIDIVIEGASLGSWAAWPSQLPQSVSVSFSPSDDYSLAITMEQ